MQGLEVFFVSGVFHIFVSPLEKRALSGSLPACYFLTCAPVAFALSD
jgi:hypothetical protein